MCIHTEHLKKKIICTLKAQGTANNQTTTAKPRFCMLETVAAPLGNPLSALLGEQLNTCRYRMHHTGLYSLEQNT